MNAPHPSATLYSLERGVATITLNRPENRNALSIELVDSLGRDLDRALADPAARVVVLTNVGNTFCAGADLKAALASTGANAQPTSGRSFLDIFDLILDSPKPIVGRLAGHCLGNHRQRRLEPYAQRVATDGASCLKPFTQMRERQSAPLLFSLG